MDKTGKKNLLLGIVLGVLLVTGISAAYNYFSSNLIIQVNRTMSVNEKIETIYKILDSYYVNDYDKNEVEEGIYAGMVNKLDDPYSTYMDAEALKNFQHRMNGTYPGIGIIVSVDEAKNRVVVVSPFEGSPAFEAGIKPGDYIIKIDGTDVDGSTYNEAVELLRGEAGSKTTLTLLRESDSSVFEAQIVREDVDLPTVSHKMLESEIGYIRISSFDEVTSKQYASSYNDLTKKGMRSLILDLRNNPGGLLNVVCEIADTLVDTEYIVYTENKQGTREYTYGDKKRIEIPLIVLINGNSASASEVLSGAVKDTGTGVLVGEKSFGKGLVQSVKQLPDGSGIKVTIAKYYTPSGVCIDGTGIVPNYTVEMDSDMAMNIASLTQEEDVQLKKAVDVATMSMALGRYPDE
ncbi:MAG: S41 family peptidase [Clostridiales bacterium]|jgi:carboxyl-terminal processing protease|nr:S41 family peptidase [Clostridiales bacterium]